MLRLLSDLIKFCKLFDALNHLLITSKLLEAATQPASLQQSHCDSEWNSQKSPRELFQCRSHLSHISNNIEAFKPTEMFRLLRNAQPLLLAECKSRKRAKLSFKRQSDELAIAQKGFPVVAAARNLWTWTNVDGESQKCFMRD